MNGVVAASVAAKVPVPRSGRASLREPGSEGRAEFADGGDLWTWGVMVPALNTSVGFTRRAWWSVLDMWQHKNVVDVGVRMRENRSCGIPDGPFSADCGSNVELVTDELVTNAVARSRPSGGLLRASTVRVMWHLVARGVYVEVDGPVVAASGESAKKRPRLEMPDEESETGRGLWLVHALSRDWGWFQADDSRIVVWSVVDR